jgi:hypothetical protein
MRFLFVKFPSWEGWRRRGDGVGIFPTLFQISSPLFLEKSGTKNRALDKIWDASLGSLAKLLFLPATLY